MISAGLPAIANRLAVPLATAMCRCDFPLNFPALANGIAVSLATAFVGDRVLWQQRSLATAFFDQEFPFSIRDLQMCSGQEVMKEWQMCILLQSYSYDEFVSNFWDAVHFA